MSRDIHPDTQSEIEGTPSWGLMAEFEISDSYTARFFTGQGELVWNGNTFLGTGEFGGVSRAQENADGVLDTVTYSLSGIDSAVTGAILTDLLDNGDFVGRPARCFFVTGNELGEIIGEPILLRADIMRDLEVSDVGTKTQATLTANSPEVPRGSASFRVYSDLDQQGENPGDDFFKNVEGVGVRSVILG